MNNLQTENRAAFTATAFGWFRKDVPMEVNRLYWRDIHGVLAARIPGLYQYRQLHLEECTQLFDPIPGISDALPVVEQPDGIAQLLFLTQEDVHTFGTHPFVTKFIFEDEQYLVERNATLWSPDHTAVTVKDAPDEATPQGLTADPAFLIAFRQQPAVEVAAFRQFMKAVAQQWAASDNVLRLRYHLMEPYDDRGWRSPNVRHDWDREDQYQAWIELVVADESRIKALVPPADADQYRQHVKAIHSYPVFEKYTLVYNGQPTDVGYRGYPATQVIARAGAKLQQSADLLEALYGAPAGR